MNHGSNGGDTGGADEGSIPQGHGDANPTGPPSVQEASILTPMWQFKDKDRSSKTSVWKDFEADLNVSLNVQSRNVGAGVRNVLCVQMCNDGSNDRRAFDVRARKQVRQRRNEAGEWTTVAAKELRRIWVEAP